MLHYCEVDLPNREWTWAYRADLLASELSQALSGQTLEKLWVEFVGYLNPLVGHRANYVDMRYLGGPVLLTAEKTVWEIDVAGEGLIRYRRFDPWKVKMRRRVTENREMGYGDRDCFYDLSLHGGLFGEPFGTIQTVTVGKTDSYPFEVYDFDPIRARTAMERGDLPLDITLHCEHAILQIIPDEYENYTITVAGP